MASQLGVKSVNTKAGIAKINISWRQNVPLPLLYVYFKQHVAALTV